MRPFLFLIALLMLLAALPARAEQVRIKDIADVEGVRDNQLIGYGLVVGLNGTGDSLTRPSSPGSRLIGMLERLGVNTRDVPTCAPACRGRHGHGRPAGLRPQGTRSMSPSRRSGIPRPFWRHPSGTPLLGADGEVYAVAQAASPRRLPGQGAAAR